MLNEKIHYYDAQDRLTTTHIELPDDDWSERFTYSDGGNILTAAGEQYSYDRADLPQAVTELQHPDGSVRQLDYDDSGRMVFDEHRDSDGDIAKIVDVTYDAAGCMRRIDRIRYDQSGDVTSDETTRHVCGQGGRRVLRETIDNETGETQRVIDFAGIAEIRPDDGQHGDGVMLLRLPFNGAITVEDARSLETGDRDPTESSYVHTDIRGSTLAETAWSGPASVPTTEVAYGPWGQSYELSSAPKPRHQTSPASSCGPSASEMNSMQLAWRESET